MFVLFNLFNIEFIKLRGKTLIEVTLFNLVPLWLLTESEYWRLPGLLHLPQKSCCCMGCGGIKTELFCHLKHLYIALLSLHLKFNNNTFFFLAFGIFITCFISISPCIHSVLCTVVTKDLCVVFIRIVFLYVYV